MKLDQEKNKKKLFKKLKNLSILLIQNNLELFIVLLNMNVNQFLKH